MTERWLETFGPDSDALFEVLLPIVSADMLQEIAAADYGRDIEQHLAPLLQFRDHRIVPILNWHPLEVLELIQWSEPEQPEWKPGLAGIRGHYLRVFVCALLLRAYERPENQKLSLSFNETAIRLVDSLRAIDGPIVQEGVRFLAWCVCTLARLDQHAAEGPFLALALLSLVAPSDRYADDDVISLCQWIDKQVSALLQNQQHWTSHQGKWLLSTEPYDQSHGRWTELGRHLYQWAEAGSPSDRTVWVALVGRVLAEN
ncbi:hypothetical protein [Rhabdaerophilum sp. SD176]|uniref:hypothetical protein n=1 Tax=Rhabdaerophilum sp. SD176 TaxID=2983548 RepID=UPI0024DF8BA0|nr:hypothetical protein [Rhabdaerophilum sp. SD176]